MSARTWEEATQDVAIALPSWRDGAELSLDEVLQDIEVVLDDLRHSDNPHEASQFRYLTWLGAVGYVLEKWYPNGDQLSHDFVRRCDDAVRSVLVLLPKKQHDYGPDNILWGGVQGVVVRAHDKLARIKNLRQRAEWAARQDVYGGEPVGPLNESLADSYFDLIGYGIVGAMLVKGTFQLPLEADAMVAIHAERVSPFFTADEQKLIREIVRGVLAERERAKLHG